MWTVLVNMATNVTRHCAHDKQTDLQYRVHVTGVIKIGKVHIFQAMWPAIKHMGGNVTCQSLICHSAHCRNLTYHDEHEQFSSPVKWIMARPTSCDVHSKRCAVWQLYGPQWQPVTAQGPRHSPVLRPAAAPAGLLGKCRGLHSPERDRRLISCD
jgi:hypothetical protein